MDEDSDEYTPSPSRTLSRRNQGYLSSEKRNRSSVSQKSFESQQSYSSSEETTNSRRRRKRPHQDKAGLHAKRQRSEQSIWSVSRKTEASSERCKSKDSDEETNGSSSSDSEHSIEELSRDRSLHSRNRRRKQNGNESEDRYEKAVNATEEVPDRSESHLERANLPMQNTENHFHIQLRTSPQRESHERDNEHSQSSIGPTLSQPNEPRRLPHHRVGSVLSLTLHQFLSYRSFTVYFGPGLNVVLGTNGSGKSTLLLALALVLGGSPAIAARGKRESDYIMTGCDAGSVRAVLRGKGTKRGTSTRSSNGVLELLWTDEIVIERVFHRSEKSEFFVCGRPCKEAEVRMACLSLGIDVSSPAVLLQQEKAAAVAMLSQTGRLSLLEDAIESHENRMAIAEESGRGHDAASERHANTQSAALQMEYRDDEPRGSATQTTDVECFSNGGTRTGELPRNAPVNELHRLASSKCKLIKEQNERIRAIERKNEEEKIKLKEIEEQLEVYKSKVSLQHQIDILKAKKHRILYEEELKRCQDAKEDVAKRREVLAKEKRAVHYDKNMEQLPVFKRLVARLERSVEECRSNAHQCTMRLMSTSAGESLHEIQSSIATLSEREEQNKVTAARIARDLADTRQRYNAAVALRDTVLDRAAAKALEVRDRELSKSLNSVAQTLRREQSSRRERETQRDKEVQRLRRLTSRRERVIERCVAKNIPGLSRLLRLIDERRESFAQRVYGPLIAEIVPASQEAAAMLEHLLPFRLKFGFVAQTAGDHRLLLALGEEAGVSQIEMGVSDTDAFTLPPMPSFFASSGARRLIEMLDAPRAVLKFICAYSISPSVYSAPRELSIPVDALRGPGVTVFASGYCSSESVSRYDGRRISHTNSVKPPEFFEGDQEDMKRGAAAAKRRVAELEQEIASIDASIRQTSAEQTALSAEKKEILAKLQSYSQHSIVVGRLARDVSRLEASLRSAEGINFEAERATLRRRARAFPEVAAGDAARKAGAVAKFAEANAKEELETWKRNVTKAKLGALEQKLSDIREREHEIQRVERALAGALAAASKRAREEGVEVLSDEMAREFAKLPASLPALEGMVEQCVRQRAVLGVRSEGELVREKETVTARLAGGESELARLRDSLAHSRRVYESYYALWHAKVSTATARVRETFSALLRREPLGAVGDVVFTTAEDPDDCGMDIRVQFRASHQLESLDQRRQSGGERAVTTMMFLLALQTVARTPLCVVDEINQGMDEKNERNVFTRIREAIGEDSPQFIMITPKLLLGLPFDDLTTVIVVVTARGKKRRTLLKKLAEINERNREALL